jgi:hypothetical protein
MTACVLYIRGIPRTPEERIKAGHYILNGHMDSLHVVCLGT